MALGKEGFLLVEALTTMAISAMLLLALASLMSFMLRASNRSERASADVEDETRTLAALSRDVEGIEPLRWAGSDGGFVFSGTERALVFAHQTTSLNGVDRIGLVTLTSDGRQLTRRETQLPPNARSLADLPLSGVERVVQQRFAIRFAYFGRLDDGRETLSDAWTTQDALPVAVRIALSDDKGAQVSLRVPIHIDAEPGCAAPAKAVCSFVPKPQADENSQATKAERSINPDDGSGWLRYARP